MEKILLLIVLLALVATFILLIYMLYKSRNNFRDDIVRTVTKSNRIRNYILELVRMTEPEKQRDLTSDEIDRIVHIVVDRVQSSQMKKTDIADEKIASDESAPVQIDNEILYASSCDVSGVFYNVKESPFENAIFVLHVAPDGLSGLFEIYSNAYEKVTECRDYLLEACEIAGSGNTIVTEKQGVAAVNDDGKWSVMEKLKIRFS